MIIQLNNIQLLQFYRDTYPDAEIMYQGKVIDNPKSVEPITETIEESVIVESNAEAKEETKDTKNNHKKFNK